MKGILKETKEGWLVWYVTTVDGKTSIKETLPLYPDSITDNLFYGKEVEFETLTVGSKDDLIGTKYAKIKIDCTWDGIFSQYPETINGSYISLKEWLKENYNSPIKK
jgi:hypothetical protein